MAMFEIFMGVKLKKKGGGIIDILFGSSFGCLINIFCMMKFYLLHLTVNYLILYKYCYFLCRLNEVNC